MTCLSPLPILLLHGHLLCGLLYEGRAHCPLNGMGRGGQGDQVGGTEETDRECVVGGSQQSLPRKDAHPQSHVVFSSVTLGL